MYGYGYSPYFINTFLGARGGAASYLVDTYSPVAAYSLRKLSSSATNAIRVRRSSDNAEQDIGFSGNDLDTTSLSSFVGANSAYVVTWYNQGTGGASYDMVQSTAANQPRIINAGTLKTTNSKPSVEFISANANFLTNSSAITSENHEAFTVYERVTGIAAAAVFSFYGGALNKYRMIGNGASGGAQGIIVRNTTTYTIDQASSNNVQYLLGGYWTATDRSLYINNSYIGQSTTSSADFTSTALQIGLTTTTSYINSNIQEIIIFSSIQTSTRGDINTDINSYYSIY